jgi:hypothetical protein
MSNSESSVTLWLPLERQHDITLKHMPEGMCTRIG